MEKEKKRKNSIQIINIDKIITKSIYKYENNNNILLIFKRIYNLSQRLFLDTFLLSMDRIPYRQSFIHFVLKINKFFLH